MDKLELEKLLKYYDNLYYNEGVSEISDAEYDVLKESYVKEYGEYDYIPGDVSSETKKVIHTFNVSSLDKVKITEKEKLRKEIERLFPCIIQEKCDGISFVAYPDKVYATRGNGKEGDDISDKAPYLEGIGDSDYTVRSEVVMLKSMFDTINKERIANGEEPFKNTRNAVPGMFRHLDPTRIKGLKVLAYNIVHADEYNNTEEQIEMLKADGWSTVGYYVPSSVDDAIKYIESYDRDSLDYDIDGLVIKHNGDKVYGETSHHPNNAIAVKFEAEGAWTRLDRIDWQVGSKGKLTPVAKFDPVDLLGATVQSATLHNYGIVKALGLDIISCDKDKVTKTKVKVIRSNDVIPAIIAVDDSDIRGSHSYMLREPSHCPLCKKEIEKVNEQHFCRNDDCPSRILGSVLRMADKEAFNIETLSEETAIKMIKLYRSLGYKPNHPSFIFDLNFEDLLMMEGFAEKSARKLYNNIQNSKSIYFDKFLYGCNIPLIGRRAAYDIAEFYSSDPDDGAIVAMAKDEFNNFKKLSQVKGIGPKMIQSLVDKYHDNIVPFGEFPDITVMSIKVKPKAEVQLNIVVTGSFEIGRKEIKELITDSGHKMSGSVSKKTDYLLASPGEEGTEKYKNAIKLDIPIIDSIKELKNIMSWAE